MAKRNQATADASQRVASSGKQKSTPTPSAAGRATRGQSRDVSEPTSSARKRRGRAESVEGADQRPGRRQKTAARDDNLNDVDEEDDAQEADDRNDGAGVENRERSVSVHTTASSEEAKNVDVVAVPRVLELLDDATVRLAQLFVPDRQDARTRNWTNLTDHKSAEAKNYRREMGIFELQREELTSGTYIQPNAVFKALNNGNAGLSEGTQDGLHAMLVRVNVIKMIYEIIAMTRMGNDDGLAIERLRLLESVFPRFMAWHGDLKMSVTTMVDLIMRLTIGDIRTGNTPGNIEDFEQYFMAAADQTLARGLIERFSAEEMHPITAAQLQAIERDVGKHLDNVADIWSRTRDADSLAEALDDLYSQEGFEKSLLNFAQRRQKELEQEVNEHGGAEAIVEEITQLITGEASIKKSFSQKGKRPVSKAPSKGATAALKKRQSELASRQKQGQQPAPTASMMPLQDTAQAALDPKLIDPQGDGDFVPTQDDGMQQIAADNARQPSDSQGPPTSSAIMASIKKANENSRRTQILTRAPKKREKWTDAETEQLDLLIRSNVEKPLSYSDLLKADKAYAEEQGLEKPILSERRPEDLRFKARNVKTKLLRGGVILGARWDQVVLAKAQKEELMHFKVENYTQPGMEDYRGSGVVVDAEEGSAEEGGVEEGGAEEGN